jgi:hypothetical protein
MVGRKFIRANTKPKTGLGDHPTATGRSLDTPKLADSGRGSRCIWHRSNANARAPRRQGKAVWQVDILFSAVAGHTVRDQPRRFVVVVDRRRSRCNRYNPRRQLMPATHRQGGEEKSSSGLRNPRPRFPVAEENLTRLNQPGFVVTVVRGKTSPACVGRGCHPSRFGQNQGATCNFTEDQREK